MTRCAAVELRGPALRALQGDAARPEAWTVLELRGSEALNSLFSYRMLVQCADASRDLRPMLGLELQVWLSSGRQRRCIAGLLVELEQRGCGAAACAATPGAQASLLLRPWPYLADLRPASRVHQDCSVVDVLRELLGRYAWRWELRLQRSFPRLDYLVQFDETDWEFVERLCARWGLHLHFEHDADGHQLVVGDGPQAFREQPLRSLRTLELRRPSRGEEPDAVQSLCAEAAQGVQAWESEGHAECHPRDLRCWRDDVPEQGAAQTRMRRWRGSDGVCRPRRDIDAGPDPAAGAAHEDELVRMRLRQARGGLTRLRGHGALPGLAACHTALLRPPWRSPAHAAAGDERRHLVARVAITLHAGAALRDDGRDQPGLRVDFDALALGDASSAMPARRLRVLGAQTATVLDARQARDAGDFSDLLTDRVGRLRVRLHWAHADARAATCWIRMARPASGDAMGSAAWPRAGQEVLVDFLDGDPDAPICLGGLRNPDNPPPWPLPRAAGVAGWHSHELRRGDSNAADATGSHVLFDDSVGALQAQLACTRHASALNLGSHAPLDRHRGRLEARGEGFELRTDAHGVVRAGRSLVVFAGAAAGAADAILRPLRACAARLLDALQARGRERVEGDALGGMARGPGAQLAAELEVQASQPDACLAAPQASALALRADGGLQLTGPRCGLLTAAGHLACSALRHVSAQAGAGLHLHAGQSASFTAARRGLQLLAVAGDLGMRAEAGELGDDTLRGLLGAGSDIARGRAAQRHAQILRAYQQQVVLPCSSRLAGRFPLQRGGRDAELDDFKAYFAPGGSADACFATYLKPWVDTTRRPWRYRSEAELADRDPTQPEAPADVDRELLRLLRRRGPDPEAFARIATLREALWRNVSTSMQWNFELSVPELDPRLTTLRLELDGKGMRYAHGPVLPWQAAWPGERAGNGSAYLRLEAADGTTAAEFAEQGPWAWMHLLAHGARLPRGAAGGVDLRFSAGDRQAVLHLGGAEPQLWKPGVLEGFRCPR